MNINEAKDYIKHSIQVYLKKDEFGDYKIPVVRQRPIFLLGAPGIGKTAIMVQIAQEMGILDKVLESGWKSLSAKETGRIGGLLASKRKEEKEDM